MIAKERKKKLVFKYKINIINPLTRKEVFTAGVFHVSL